jgi:CRISPR system Cascade subunit CasE
MTSTLHISRARLRANHGEVLSAIAPILMPPNPAVRVGHAHRLVWLLFQSELDRKRDFLWREEGHGRYLILSPEPPSDPSGLFELETKGFSPRLAAGDRLVFVLRANAVVSRKGARDDAEKAERARGKRVDVVMEALYAIPKEDRAKLRRELTDKSARRWLDEQGSRAGFRVLSLRCNGYECIDIADRTHPGRRARAGISVLDLEGTLEVREPGRFLEKISRGFGSAKAFGCGLMLIRRTR